MHWILKSFLRGLLIVVPVAATVFVLHWLFTTLDSLVDLGLNIPGSTFLMLLVSVTLVGILASNVLTSWMVRLMDGFFKRVPLAKLIYSAVKDMMEAFVGDQKKFDKPVIVSLGDQVGGEILGFLTRQDLEWLGAADRVAVYFPQSYNFAGSVVLFPRDRITPIQADASTVMQFIVSGGVSGERKPAAVK
jgi:uncharacterized membrane protein